MKPEGEAPRHAVRAAAASLGLQLLPDQVERLVEFDRLLRERAVPLGLLAQGEEGRTFERHVLDSLRAAALVDRADREGVDIGSGAGLPGLPVAIARPRLHVHLVEPRRRRAAFLELAVERLGIPNASVLMRRAEAVDVVADVALARALAPLGRSCALAFRLLRPGGRLLYFSGPIAEPPSMPLGAARIAVVGEKPVDSGGPVVIITRE